MRRLVFRECLCKEEGVGGRYEYHDETTNHMLFQCKSGFICKSAERVDGRMSDNAGEQASATIKYRYKQEAYGDRKANLTQIVYQVHAAAVE